MTVDILEPAPVAKKQPSERDRIDLRVDPILHARIKVQAERLNISVAAYIKQSISRQLERDEAETGSASP
jgi:predicted HicB family RNase H-like nuclease